MENALANQVFHTHRSFHDNDCFLQVCQLHRGVVQQVCNGAPVCPLHEQHKLVLLDQFAIAEHPHDPRAVAEQAENTQLFAEIVEQFGPILN